MNLLVISSYPRKGLTHDNKTVGVASYTKNTIQALKKLNPNTKITIWSESNKSWQRNSFSSLFRLCLKLIKSNHNHLFLPHEFNMFGNPSTIIFFPLILLINRLKKIPSTLILHQVVTDFQTVARHANLPQPTTPLINLIAKLYYSCLVTLSSQTIVFEKFLKQRLPQKLHSKIIVIPHAVEAFKKTKKTQPPKSGHLNLLVFGYLAHYKGTDWIIKAFKNYLQKYPNKKLHLTIAGGPNPNHLNKPHYQKYIEKINKISQHPQITLTGFVKEKNISKVFSRASLVILPYRTAMSSSGPLSIALSHHRPFIISQSLQPYAQTKDFQDTLNKLELTLTDITYPFTQEGFNSFLNKLLKNKQILSSLTQFSQNLAQKRSWSKIAKHYLNLLTTPTC